eukprot:scaffold241581_cov28-Tisochrysis_lutea.AAC.3
MRPAPDARPWSRPLLAGPGAPHVPRLGALVRRVEDKCVALAGREVEGCHIGGDGHLRKAGCNGWWPCGRDLRWTMPPRARTCFPLGGGAR